MSAFIEKQRFVDWLDDSLRNATGLPAWYAYLRVINQVEAGRFDWSSEGE